VSCVREDADRDKAEKPPGCGGKAEAPTWAPAPLNATGESEVVSERSGRAVAKAGLAKPPFSYRGKSETRRASTWENKPKDSDDEQSAACRSGGVLKVIPEDV
jgi:hypothetical protein